MLSFFVPALDLWSRALEHALRGRADDIAIDPDSHAIAAERHSRVPSPTCARGVSAMAAPL